VPEVLQIRLQTLEQTEALVDSALTSQSLAEFAEQLPITAVEPPSNKEDGQ
jgi:hypothetical protein